MMEGEVADGLLAEEGFCPGNFGRLVEHCSVGFDLKKNISCGFVKLLDFYRIFSERVVLILPCGTSS